MFSRILDMSETLKRKSILLIGPRQTGKTTYLREHFPKAQVIDLLQTGLYRSLSADPSLLTQIVSAGTPKTNLFVIDEVQKVPELLDEVHRLIELDKKLRFILTGSSARKLKRQGTNLLGGRASRFYFHPLVWPEFAGANSEKSEKYLAKALRIGSLPSILTSDAPEKDLEDYVGLYLKEEIHAEGLARNIANFSNFMNAAAMTQAEQINFTAVASDAQVPQRTVVDYFGVLQDTLIGYLVPAYTKTKKRKAMSSAKFYFFDVGVGNALLGRTRFSANSSEFGKALEHFIFNQLKAYLDYQQSTQELSYWRSTSGFEVDFVIPTGRASAISIEVKASRNPQSRDYKGLLALEEDVQLQRKIVVCQSPVPMKTPDGVEIMPISHFLNQLWQGHILAEPD